MQPSSLWRLRLRSIPDEIGVVAQLVHRACAPRRHPLFFALHHHRRPFHGPRSTLAERHLHTFPRVLVHARRCAAKHVEELGRVRRGNGDGVVLGVALCVVLLSLLLFESA